MNDNYIVRWLFEAKIYALTDLDGNVFYIGCTVCSLTRRLRDHVYNAKKFGAFSNSDKAKKIRELNCIVKIKKIDSFGVFGTNRREAQMNAASIEEKWIKHYKNIGAKLCNVWHLTKNLKKTA